MSPLRAPTVGGLAGGVGATTVARALHAREIGRVGDAGRLPDVVVCRATLSGLALAERPDTAGAAPAPVLAVTAVGGEPDEAVVERLAAPRPCCLPRGYSSLMFASRATFVHLSISARISLSNAAGVLASGSSPCAPSVSIIAG